MARSERRVLISRRVRVERSRDQDQTVIVHRRQKRIYRGLLELLDSYRSMAGNIGFGFLKL